jgi:hypothetical protein
MADQTKTTQLNRLWDARCPIHGLPLTQLENYDHDINGRRVEGGGFCIAGCPRDDCSVRVTALGPTKVGKLIAPVELVDRLETSTTH